MNDIELIEPATIEAIYWWNDSEDFYHKCFKRIDEIIEDEDYWEFFKQKILKTFLNNYSIRRNIPAGDDGLDKYFKEISASGFINEVNIGNADIIDRVSKMQKEHYGAKGKNTKSLLSKIAHMINPNAFPIFDTFAKDSLWIRVKEQPNNKLKKKDFDNYTKYKEGILGLIDEINRKKQFETAYSMLDVYKGTLAYKFYKENPEAFKFRVVDKLLWLEGVKRNSDKKGENFKFDYIYCYKEFHEFVEK